MEEEAALPTPGEEWQAWLTDIADFQREMADASERWVSANSRECTCGAKIQRNGGCNHMICTVCGRHFCYVCGRDWAEHRGQEGGVDFYNCRLPPGPTGGSAEAAAPGPPPTPLGAAGPVLSALLPAVLVGRGGASMARASAAKRQRVEACFSGWVANARDPDYHKQLVEALLYLADAFGLGVGFQEVLADGGAACLEARQCLQRCYVLRYHWGQAAWLRRLEGWVGELEQATGALESAVGLVQLDAALVRDRRGHAARTPRAGRQQRPPSAQKPEELLRRADLRQLLPHALAATEAEAALRQLATAVVLQRARLLGALWKELGAARAERSARAAGAAAGRGTAGMLAPFAGGGGGEDTGGSQCVTM